MARLGLSSQLDGVLGKATPLAASQVISLLSAPRFTDSAALTAAALGSLKTAIAARPAGEEGSALDRSAVLNVGAELNAPEVGEGLMTVEKASAGETLGADALQALAEGTHDALAIDRAVRASQPADVSTLSGGLSTRPRAAVSTVRTVAPAPTSVPVPKPTPKSIPSSAATGRSSTKSTSTGKSKKK